MTPWLLVCLGAAVGAPLRYLLDRRIERGLATPLPLGTLTVNVVGSLLLGGLLGAQAAGATSSATSSTVLLLVGTGFCGAFTTYSAFAVEVVALGRRGRSVMAAGYALASPLLALGCATAGYALGRLV